VNITVLDAARGVNGSSLLVETPYVRFLVGCGMVQCGREAPARNRQPYAFDPRTLDFVLLTQAQIGRIGPLPKLTRSDLAGSIFATADLLVVTLPDIACPGVVVLFVQIGALSPETQYPCGFPAGATLAR